jgi:excisionase family DNA binding protein
MKDYGLSVDEIGKYIGACNDTAYRKINKHEMLPYRMGCLWKFKKNRVKAWINTGGVNMMALLLASRKAPRKIDGKSVRTDTRQQASMITEKGHD